MDLYLVSGLGKKTAEYLDYVVNRILVVGAGYLAAVCLLPEILRSQFAIPFFWRNISSNCCFGYNGYNKSSTIAYVGTSI